MFVLSFDDLIEGIRLWLSMIMLLNLINNLYLLALFKLNLKSWAQDSISAKYDQFMKQFWLSEVAT